MKTIKTLKTIAATLAITMAIALFVAYEYFDLNIVVPAILYVSFMIFIVIALYVGGMRKKDDLNAIVKEINASASLALQEGNIGILAYDKNFIISFMSDMFTEKNMYHVGEKVLTWLPELQDIINGGIEKRVIIINEDKYEVTKREGSYVLIFKDISVEYDLEKKLKDESYVLGLCNFDNYDEASESEDTVSYVNANIKLPVIEYFKEFGIVYRTLRNNRLQLILNYSKYEALLKDRFSILNTVRKEAKKADLDITLSMSFAYNYDNLSELDNEVSNLLEIAQTRGGDQVVVKEYQKEAVFYGGSSEAREKQSKVKVRVMANTMKHLIMDAENVIIVGHANADSDCIGSMLGMDCIAKAFNKNTMLVTLTGEIESMTKDAMSHYAKELNANHHFVSEGEAISSLTDNSLVIMCDHHMISQSNAQAVLKQAKNVMIIDHHRRKADLDVNVSMLYVEASASSTSEIVSEFFTYIPRIQVEDAVANIMYIGLIIDTNHFRVRSGARTFDAAKTLKRLGADSMTIEELISEPYINVMKRAKMISNAKRYEHDIIINCLEDGSYSRSVASQATDVLIGTKEVEAVFTLCYDEDEALITARSKGNINVQVILEKMGGGGHMTAAGLQRKNANILDVRTELMKCLNEYYKEKETANESNIA